MLFELEPDKIMDTWLPNGKGHTQSGGESSDYNSKIFNWIYSGMGLLDINVLWLHCRFNCIIATAAILI